MARTRTRMKGRRDDGNFMRVPASVANSPNFCRLSTKAKALILDLGARYNGHNNGDLAMPWSWMKLRNWRSKQTLKNAKDELLQYGMIELTRQGGLHGPSLYAFSWMPINECKGKLDVPATSVASGNWKLPPLKAAA